MARMTVFSAEWFAYHQRILLWLLNAPIIDRWFRWVLCIRRHDAGYRGRIVALLPHAYTVANDDGTRTTDFRTHAKYGKRLYYAFRPLWWALHTWDQVVANPLAPVLNVGFDTLTAYPDPGDPGTTTCDGTVKRVGVDEAFGTITGTGNSVNVSAVDDYIYLAASTTSNQFGALFRGVWVFNTSALPVVPTAVTLSLWQVNKSNVLGDTSLDVVSVAPASNTTLVAGDYSTFGTTAYGTVSYAAFGAGYNDISITASSVAVAGITKYGGRLGWDRSGSFGGAWVSGGNTFFNVYMADQTGTSNDPKLVVTYAVPGRVPRNNVRPRIFAPGRAR